MNQIPKNWGLFIVHRTTGEAVRFVFDSDKTEADASDMARRIEQARADTLASRSWCVESRLVRDEHLAFGLKAGAL